MQPANASAPDEDAAFWAVRLAAAGDDPAVRAGAQRWLAAGPGRAGELLRAQAVLQLTIGDTAAEPAASAPVSRRQLLWGSGALAAGLAAGLLAWDRRGEVRTDVGEIRQLPLPDGSSVALNTASAVRVRFDSRERRLLLAAGEALFHVARAADRPFVVIAGQVVITAVGTILAVRRDAAAVVVLVTEGLVDVADGPLPPVRLRAGQQGRFAGPDSSDALARPAPVIASVTPDTAARQLAWRDGRLEFAGETAGEAIAMANRYSRRPIHLADPALATLPVHGAFRIDDVPGLARTLAAALGQPLREQPDRLVIGTAPGRG